MTPGTLMNTQTPEYPLQLLAHGAWNGSCSLALWPSTKVEKAQGTLIQSHIVTCMPGEQEVWTRCSLRCPRLPDVHVR